MAPKTSEAQGSKRTKAREQVMQLLFTREFVTEETPEQALQDASDVMDDIVLEKYACELYEGVVNNIDAIDAAIEGASENWSLSRMAFTDRSILRIAVYELLYRDDIPSGVSINEAVELAQSFGGEDDSYRFVNGVLGKIASSLEGDADADAVKPEEEVGE